MSYSASFISPYCCCSPHYYFLLVSFVFDLWPCFTLFICFILCQITLCVSTSLHVLCPATFPLACSLFHHLSRHSNLHIHLTFHPAPNCFSHLSGLLLIPISYSLIHFLSVLDGFFPFLNCLGVACLVVLRLDQVVVLLSLSFVLSCYPTGRFMFESSSLCWSS